MIFYVSIRPITVDGKRLLTPKYMLNDGFRGIPITWKCLASNIKDDGRYLYEIETDTLEHQEVILEGLQLWAAHLKTLKSTEILAKKLLNRKDLTIKEDKLIIPILRDELI